MIDFAALESAWRSSANNPSAAASAYLASELASTVRRRRAAIDRSLVFAGVAMAAWVGLIAVDVVAGRADPIDLLKEWAVVPLLAIPAVLFAMVLLVRRRRAPAPDARTPLAEAFRAALADNVTARLHLRLIMGGQLAAAVLLGVALQQLGAVGKMAPHEQVSATAVLGGALLVSLGFVVVRYVTQLMPERRQLESLLTQYND